MLVKSLEKIADIHARLDRTYRQGVPLALYSDFPISRTVDDPDPEDDWQEISKYDTSPLGDKKNWVTKVGGLPDFVRAVAHALIRDVHSESEAIQIAIGTMKAWAAGHSA
jgi:hypothetical protein